MLEDVYNCYAICSTESVRYGTTNDPSGRSVCSYDDSYTRTSTMSHGCAREQGNLCKHGVPRGHGLEARTVENHVPLCPSWQSYGYSLRSCGHENLLHHTSDPSTEPRVEDGDVCDLYMSSIDGTEARTRKHSVRFCIRLP